MASMVFEPVRVRNVGEMALNWLDADHRPRLIVSDTLRVLWASTRARRMLDRHSGIFIEDGALSFIKEQAARTMRGLVHRADAEIATAVIPIDGGQHYLFRGWRVPGSESDAVLLEFCIDCDTFTPAYAHLSDVFGLTAMELEVLTALLCGSTVADVASAKAIGIVTVRSHVRGIYNKIGVDSRERLFSRLSAFRIL